MTQTGVFRDVISQTFSPLNECLTEEFSVFKFLWLNRTDLANNDAHTTEGVPTTANLTKMEHLLQTDISESGETPTISATSV